MFQDYQAISVVTPFGPDVLSPMAKELLEQKGFNVAPTHDGRLRVWTENQRTAIINRGSLKHIAATAAEDAILQAKDGHPISIVDLFQLVLAGTDEAILASIDVRCVWTSSHEIGPFVGAIALRVYRSHHLSKNLDKVFNEMDADCAVAA